MSKIAVAIVAALALGSVARAQPLKDDTQKSLYALGVEIGKSLKTMDLKPAELDLVKRGLTDQVTGKKPLVDTEQMRPQVQAYFEKRRTDALKSKEKAVVDEAKKEKGAQVLPSGVIYVPVKEGTGAQPKPTDGVKVNYTGKFTDGTVFDSSVPRGQPIDLQLNGVIKCWTEGVAKMKVGGKAKLVCPGPTAYGARGAPPTIPPDAMLVFDIELLDVKPAVQGGAPQGGQPQPGGK